ncbi:recombination mediator RecR [Salininema proteolyticum]|uniref:Recombination protein RecR n=1 Tax=Salininema proteolyticum TaxID=1607685 RepID=A0ABV8U3V2_9ACTN
MVYDGALAEVIEQLGALPGIGPKSAQRLAFHLLAAEEEEVQVLADALLRLKRQVRFCDRCGNVSEQELCTLCQDQRRTEETLCVVEEPKDVMAIERTGEYRGRYHVLGGAINPLDGVGPDDLRIKQLMERLQAGETTEVILATDPNTEGEATATYIAMLLQPLGITVTRLASGLPVGGDLEYADEVTLGRAFAGRRDIGG